MLQSQMPPRAPAGSFQMSAFGAAAQVPSMDALEMHLANMQGMPGFGEAHRAMAQPWPAFIVQAL